MMQFVDTFSTLLFYKWFQWVTSIIYWGLYSSELYRSTSDSKLQGLYNVKYKDEATALLLTN